MTKNKVWKSDDPSLDDTVSVESVEPRCLLIRPHQLEIALKLLKSQGIKFNVRGTSETKTVYYDDLIAGEPTSTYGNITLDMGNVEFSVRAEVSIVGGQITIHDIKLELMDLRATHSSEEAEKLKPPRIKRDRIKMRQE
jgi:hypothetical protein